MKLRPFRNFLPQPGARVFIDDAAVVIGQVSLGDDASVWPCAVVRGDVAPITIGARTNIQDGSVLHVNSPASAPPNGMPLIIGADVTVGHKAILHACTVGDRCLVGMGAIVLDGAVLEEDILIGSGAVVTPGKHLEAGGLYVGSPARRVRSLTDAELGMLKESAKRYVALKNAYL